jgi:ribosome-associated protein
LAALYERAYPQVKTRLSAGRLTHTLAVVQAAEQLAIRYGVGVPVARLAALLHDWDRDLPLDELMAAAERHGIEVPESPERLLHAFTGAQAVAGEFADLPPEVVRAIERHTLAAAGMSDLDMVVYVADLIEPGRRYPEIERLRGLVSHLPLHQLFQAALEATFVYLTSRQRAIHPQSLAAHADIIARIQAAADLDVPTPTGGPVKTSREIALAAAEAAYDKKATDIIVQEVTDTMMICDYLVLATGANNRQVDAICESIEDKLRLEAASKPMGREGLGQLEWVLLDYGDVVVHVFQPETREFYRLETLWGDSPIVDLAEAGIAAPEYSERLLRLQSGQHGDEDGSIEGPEAEG